MISQGNYTAPAGDPQDDYSQTEQAGYIPPALQIERLVMAGKNLNEFRKELFDLTWSEELDLDDIDVIKVRDRNYDIADAFQDSLYIKMKVKEEKLKRKHHAEKQKKQDEDPDIIRSSKETKPTPEPEEGVT